MLNIGSEFRFEYGQAKVMAGVMISLISSPDFNVSLNLEVGLNLGWLGLGY